MIPSTIIRKLSKLACIATAAVVWQSHASVIVNGTRVVYNGQEKEVSVRLTNTGTLPVLVQSWIDDGDMNAKPDRIRSPFTLTPPINRINADKSQTLRISYTGSPALPQNKESVYWLNLLEVPAAKKDNSINKLNVAFRTRIKLFYRPAGLADKAKVTEAAEKIRWSISGGKLTATNSSPYYISLVSVSFKNAGSSGSIEGEMVPPMGSYTFNLPASVRAGAGSLLTYEYVNDWGALRKVEYTL
ncbi:chaperone protein EcpD [Klebsiella oxytoca]|uniref:Chaperone protein EcpD n=1 Tax=Klebsiella oxytoca TaxID=571 RepID=A0A318G0V2_KLEOX|nr:fimbria/pilus periplasmic chaperone [Klebsiella oxytoca]PXW49397.1 chaperone protein EcpD [Klebsiella oxytoca]HCB1498029.1 fimbria/pilus periplasmic chaperone [Klebsiella michiganensis]HCB1843724.1 fimbria/pilus periplasmic chaperone [Klebsiella oxytoca]